MNAGKPLAKGRVGELVEILTELEDSEEDEDGRRRLSAPRRSGSDSNPSDAISDGDRFQSRRGEA